MYFHRLILIFVIAVTFLTNNSKGFYIKAKAAKQRIKSRAINSNGNEEEWSVFQQKLGLSNQKINFLKAQKDPKGTLELLKKFVDENPNYTNNKTKIKKIKNPETSNSFINVYNKLLQQLKLSHTLLKTSFNFELVDKPQKILKRSRRRIAVKMVSDMPVENIDELLKMFSEKHNINNQEDDDGQIDDDTGVVPESDMNYDEYSPVLPSAMDPDYMYENLYEDEEDLAVPAKSKHNSQYGSLQDLILQASRNQLQRELEETKLRNRINEHFI